MWFLNVLCKFYMNRGWINDYWLIPAGKKAKWQMLKNETRLTVKKG